MDASFPYYSPGKLVACDVWCIREGESSRSDWTVGGRRHGSGGLGGVGLGRA